jgi:hypothetical protein
MPDPGKSVLFTDRSVGDVKYLFKKVCSDVNRLQLLAVSVCCAGGWL